MQFSLSPIFFRFFILATIVSTLFFFSNCNDNPYKQGKILYELYCQNCHMENGEGLKGLIPPLARADFLIKHRDQLPCIIRKGLKGNIEVNNITYGQQQMLPIDRFSDFEITNILNFVDHNWGNSGKLWTVDEVTGYAKDCPPLH